MQRDEYVRVSTILSRFESYDHIDKELLEAKAKIGTNVHQAIIQDCADGFYILETERAKAYFESYRMWKDKQEAKPVITQVPRLYCDEVMLQGECDGLLNEVLIDWKCSANAHEENWSRQAHMYWYLLTQNGYKPQDVMRWINLRHKKSIKYGKAGMNTVKYYPLEPKVYTFKFDEDVLQECLNEVICYYEEKACAMDLT